MAAATLQPAAGAAGELTGLLLMRAYHDAARRAAPPGRSSRTRPTAPTRPRSPWAATRSVDRAERRPGLRRHGRAARRPRHRRGRDHADQPQHARALRGGHRRDRRRRARGGRAALLRRRQPQRHPRRGPARRHGLRHRAHEPAQDLRHAPRRRGTRRRARWRCRPAWSSSCPAPGRCAGGLDGYDVRLGRPARSIGRVHGWHGNALVLARALAYIEVHGGDGLRRVAERAVLNANWIRRRLLGTYDVPFDRPCMHEVVLSAANLQEGARHQGPRRGQAPPRGGLPLADGRTSR